MLNQYLIGPGSLPQHPPPTPLDRDALRGDV
jgi:hypothetical protein